MRNRFICLAISLILYLNSFAAFYPEGVRNDSINDGPYIYFVDTELQCKWIENSIVHARILTAKTFPETKKKFNLLFDYKDIKHSRYPKANYRQKYTGVDSIAAISDIHGEFNSYINLMKSLGIIDENLNWNFGTGHLVIIGDSFDRGDMVTEVLWHLFGLEKQALKAGGMVHMILGNHESLVLGNDLRYISDKYIRVEALTGLSYTDLYSAGSVLGRWLRYQPAVISINDIIFVHGGLSIEMVHRKLKIEQINRFFSDLIFGNEITEVAEAEEIKFLKNDNGPIWYRGFFTDKSFCESRLDSILTFYDTRHIIVGHTVCEDIQSLFNNKIFGIDAGIGNDQPGKMLIYKEGIFYQGFETGKRVKF
jgi:hypothetical protein